MEPNREGARKGARMTRQTMVKRVAEERRTRVVFLIRARMPILMVVLEHGQRMSSQNTVMTTGRDVLASQNGGSWTDGGRTSVN
jgi:hypothetical protein